MKLWQTFPKCREDMGIEEQAHLEPQIDRAGREPLHIIFWLKYPEDRTKKKVLKATRERGAKLLIKPNPSELHQTC
jgi:hypothetical protein